MGSDREPHKKAGKRWIQLGWTRCGPRGGGFGSDRGHHNYFGFSRPRVPDVLIRGRPHRHPRCRLLCRCGKADEVNRERDGLHNGIAYFPSKKTERNGVNNGVNNGVINDEVENEVNTGERDGAACRNAHTPSSWCHDRQHPDSGVVRSSRIKHRPHAAANPHRGSFDADRNERRLAAAPPLHPRFVYAGPFEAQFEGKQEGDRQRVAIFRVAEDGFLKHVEVRNSGGDERTSDDDGDSAPWRTQPSFVVMLFLSPPLIPVGRSFSFTNGTLKKQ